MHDIYLITIYLYNYIHFVCNRQLIKSIPRMLIILYDICTLHLRHILQILRYSTRVAFSQSLQFSNYLPIIAPDYHPFVNRKGMHYLLILDFLTKYNPMKSYSILRNIENEVTINGTITRI